MFFNVLFGKQNEKDKNHSKKVQETITFSLFMDLERVSRDINANYKPKINFQTQNHTVLEFLLRQLFNILTQKYIYI